MDNGRVGRIVTEGFAEISGTRLWYWDTGGAGAALVLCHPASQSCRIWEHQRDVFAAAGFRVIGYSRRGYYKSETGKDDAGNSVGDLAALLDYLGIGKAHVLGAAAGGITATAFAVAHPGRVASLVLAGTIVSPAEPDWRELYGRLGIAELRGKVSAEFLELGPSYRAVHPAGTERFAELGALGAAHGGFSQPVGVAVTWAALEALETPVLLVTGEADLYAPPPLMQMVAGHLRRHRLETIRACGHAPYWEEPELFNRLVLDFLGSV